MNKFAWGSIIDRLSYDFDGITLEIIKYNPWVKNGNRLLVGSIAHDCVSYHCEEMNQTFNTVFELIIHWIVFKRLGLNNSSLAEGVCKAVDL